MADLSSVEKVYQYLLEAIVKGDLAPNARLRETELAVELGVGRGPLREAIHKLEARNMITKVPNVGAQVIAFDEREILEIYQLRENLEALACELAAKNMSDAKLTELQSILERHKAYLDSNDGQTYIDQDPDLDFHFFIIQCSENQWLIRLLCDELYHRVRMYRYQSAHQRSRPSKALEEHQRIFQALSNRDGELAALLMKRHIQAAKQLLLSSNDIQH
ncbi:GntR family transcriptional regulator [Reinekea forsetii]|nr:GntR family transcriptional regulator [Reinekea forsetii]